MKPPTAKVRLKAWRVQSVGYARRKPPVGRTEKPLTKSDKCSRATSAKQAGRQRKENKGSVNSSEANTVSSAFGGTEGLRTYIGEQIPGYFMEQYKKVLKKRDVTLSCSLALLPNEFSEDGAILSQCKKHEGITKTSLSSDYKKDKTSLQLSTIERSGPYKAESKNGEQGKSSQPENISQGSLSGTIVRGDNKAGRAKG